MKVHVQWTVPLSVVVDLDTKKVEDVLICEEDMRITPTVLNENHDTRIVGMAMLDAQRACYRQEWPRWRFAPLREWSIDRFGRVVERDVA